MPYSFVTSLAMFDVLSSWLRNYWLATDDELGVDVQATHKNSTMPIVQVACAWQADEFLSRPTPKADDDNPYVDSDGDSGAEQTRIELIVI
eukprot:2860937-Amphidinium_carterae.1